jgi:hypothetical protein
MSDQNQDRGYSDSTGHAASEQPWREERHQPEPKAIEGEHEGRRVPKEEQRQTRDDSGVGVVSRVEGDDAGGDPGTTHTRGAGRDTEGAFGEETARNNANPHNDFRDAGISKREVGINEHGDRTQGGDM